MTATSTNPEVLRELLASGNAALLAGNAFEARQQFRQALNHDPDNVAALVGMAGAMLQYKEKKEYLQRALALSPNNREIIATLEYVEGKLAAGELLVARPKPAPPSIPEPEPELEMINPTTTTSGEAIELLNCYIHPERETGLRCTNCSRPICSECMRRAPVGQLCPECTKARLPANYKVEPITLVIISSISIVIGVLLSFLAIFMLSILPFFAFLAAFFLGPFLGTQYVRLLDQVTKAKRGRNVQLSVGLGIGVGATPLSFLFLIGGSFFGLLMIAVLAGTTLYTAMQQLK